MKNLGVVIEHKPTDWIGGSIPYEVLNPTGDWTAYLPTGERQRLRNEDSMACVSFSCLNVIETQIKFFTGKEVNFSDRFLAKMSGTTHQGNSVQRVLDAINEYGLVLEQDWATSPQFDWNDYYAEIPQSVKDKALPIKVQYDFHYEGFADQLKHLPLEMIVEKNNPYHSVEMVNGTQQFDQYDPYLRPQQSIYLATKILVKGFTMSNAVFVKKANSLEAGFYLPATSEEALKDKALNLGVDILGVNGNIDYSKAKEITGL